MQQCSAHDCGLSTWACGRFVRAGPRGGSVLKPGIVDTYIRSTAGGRCYPHYSGGFLAALAMPEPCFAQAAWLRGPGYDT